MKFFALAFKHVYGVLLQTSFYVEHIWFARHGMTLSHCSSWAHPGLLTCLSDEPGLWDQMRSMITATRDPGLSTSTKWEQRGQNPLGSTLRYSCGEYSRKKKNETRVISLSPSMISDGGFWDWRLRLWLCINLPDNTEVIMYKLLKWKICFSLRVMLVRFLNHCDSTPVRSHVDWLRARCRALHYQDTKDKKRERVGATFFFLSSCFWCAYFTEGMCKELSQVRKKVVWTRQTFSCSYPPALLDPLCFYWYHSILCMYVMWALTLPKYE